MATFVGSYIILEVIHRLITFRWQWLEYSSSGQDKEPDYYYKLVGECYVHGMMDSEAIKLQNEGDFEARVLEIR